MNRVDTICAVGTPKNVQLPSRNASSVNRTAPYQMKKTSSRSPGRSRLRAWKPSQMRTIAPSAPDSDSYRNSGWNRVVSGRTAQV